MEDEFEIVEMPGQLQECIDRVERMEEENEVQFNSMEARLNLFKKDMFVVEMDLRDKIRAVIFIRNFKFKY